MPEIEVRCPSCSKRGKIDISEEKIKSVSRGVLAVNIGQGMLCDHSFVAYVDKNLQIRDCFMADFQIELPGSSSSTVAPSAPIPEERDLDVDLIKLNLPSKLLANALHGCFLKANIVIIEDTSVLHTHITKFFAHIMKNAYITSIVVMTSEEYLTNKKQFKDFLVLSSKEVVSDKLQFIGKKKLDVEPQMAKIFFEERDSKSSLILLKNEVFKTFDLAKKVHEFLESISDEETIHTSKICKYMEEKQQVKLSASYVKFLLEIVEKYYNFKLPKISDVSDFLGFL